MRRIGLRMSGWVVLGLAAAVLAGTGPAVAQKAGNSGSGGASCTHERCMESCNRAGGKYCSSYCEKTLKERRMSGICK